MQYIRIAKGLNDKGDLYPSDEDVYKHININEDNYSSMFLYDDKHKELFYSEIINPKTNKPDRRGCAGITDVLTNRLLFDFDSADDLEGAKKSTIELCNRLIVESVPEEALRITFSGKKGFGVEVELNQLIPPTQQKLICLSLARDLPHLDSQIYNANRLIRIPLTKHQNSGLYKIPVSLSRLKNDSIGNIKESAKQHSFNPEFIKTKWNKKVNLTDIKMPLVKTQQKVEPKVETTSDIDYSKKPQFLDNARYAIQEGHFNDGERNTALLCLASTYKNLGYKEEHVYRLLKGVAELQSKRTGNDRFGDSEIYNNIVMCVFGPTWKGGQYTLRDKDNWLYKFAIANGIPIDNDKKSNSPIQIHEVSPSFTDYVKNSEKNRITTGLPSLDAENGLFLSTGLNLGIIGAAGSGKTSILLNILNHTSKSGIKSVFASLDMHKNRLYEKLLYKVTNGKSRKEVYEIYKSGKGASLDAAIKKEFENVYIFDRSGATVDDIREYIKACEDKDGEKIKLVAIDYFERINTDLSEDTAASKRIAGELQDLANDLNICLVTLVQPNKYSLSGGAESPILSYTSIKGSSFLYQSFRVILSLWRPFYRPDTQRHDKFMEMAVLKNDLGELNQYVFGWKGKTGDIHELEDYQYDEFLRLTKEREEERASKKKSWE